MINTLIRGAIKKYVPRPKKTKICNFGGYLKICKKLHKAYYMNGVDLEPFIKRLNAYLPERKRIHHDDVSLDSLTYILADHSIQYRLDELNTILSISMLRYRYNRMFNVVTNLVG